jgi:excisionase family DNA binding protein
MTARAAAEALARSGADRWKVDGLDVEALAAAVARLVVDELRASPEGALLDAEAAAALLGVPASWVLAEARAERIPHVRLGRYVRFDRGELEAWARRRMRGPRRRTDTSPIASDGERR